MLSNKETFLQLIRIGIGTTKVKRMPENVNWLEMEALANQQGLSAIIVDSVELLPEQQRPPKTILLQWIGETLHGFEYRYELCCRTIAEMASFYNSHGYKMMVLKGYGCSVNWPKPEHRPCGDIDIWQFGKQKEADSLLVKEKGIKIDNSHHCHSVFYWQDFMVENHFNFVNVHSRKSNKELEDIFEELGLDDTHTVELYSETVYLPSVNLHALYLIKHSMNDFASFYVTLRQLLDWAFFVEKHTKEIDWGWLAKQLEKFHMRDFFNCINAICVEDLGFPLDIFKTVQFEPKMKERVLNDILDPQFKREEPSGLIKRLVYKYRRWQGNAWKQEMCYGESRWTAFWSGIWSKLLKPASI